MLSSLITIAILHWAVLLIPGFNFILIGQLAAGGSRQQAMAAVAGMVSATLIWATLALAGVGVIFSAHPLIRQVVQVSGGLYLLQLAYKLWRSGAAPAVAQQASMSKALAFRTGFITSALNPKIALFYGSVFATALPAQPSVSMVSAALMLVLANSLLWHSSLAWLLSMPRVQQLYLLRYQRLTKFSAVLVGIYGVKLLLSVLSEFYMGTASRR